MKIMKPSEVVSRVRQQNKEKFEQDLEQAVSFVNNMLCDAFRAGSTGVTLNKNNTALPNPAVRDRVFKMLKESKWNVIVEGDNVIVKAGEAVTVELNCPSVE